MKSGPFKQTTFLDSAVVSIFVVILVEFTNTVFVFVNSNNITANIETTVLSSIS